MGKPFTPERLANIRRLRKARRLYKKQPLFAYHQLCGEYFNYSHEQFLNDLRYRNKPKQRKGKSTMLRYGRYRRMEKLLDLYRETDNMEYALTALQLRRNLTKPYRVLVKIAGETWEYSFSPLIAIQQIENLISALAPCRTVKEVEELVERYRNASY